MENQSLRFEKNFQPRLLNLSISSKQLYADYDDRLNLVFATRNPHFTKAWPAIDSRKQGGALKKWDDGECSYSSFWFLF